MAFYVTSTDTLTFVRDFGVADGASDGYDAFCDIPLIVFPEDTTVFFPVDGPEVGALSSDIRSNRDTEHIWELVFQNIQYSSVFWEIEQLPEGESLWFCVHHPDSVPREWTDMQETPIAMVPVGNNVSFRWKIPVGSDTIPPYVTDWDPPDGASNIPRETDILCKVYDDDTGVDSTTIRLEVGGIDVTSLAVISPIIGGFSVNYDPPTDFAWRTEVEVVLSAYDLEMPGNFICDTAAWTTLPDSIVYAVAGTVAVGGVWTPVDGAVVKIAGRTDTTDSDGYFFLDSISTGGYMIRASAPGYTETAKWLWVDSDTSLNLELQSVAPSVEVLIIDYDSGAEPFGEDSVGEETVIANILDELEYKYAVTQQNPDISAVELDEYRFVILVTPVRGESPHDVIPDDDLDALSSWLAADGRILWIAPDAGPDYAEGSDTASAFFDMFGAVYESDGRASSPDGNVTWLYGDARDFHDDIFVSYELNSDADNYIDELSVAETTSYIALQSQISSPAPLASNGRLIFYDSMTYRTVLSSVLFGAISGTIFPNTAANILRGCMEYLEKPSHIHESSPRPKNIEIITYPNPFNSTVTISLVCHSCESGNPGDMVAVEIFDINGRNIANLPVGANLVFAQPQGDHKDRPYETVWTPDESISSGVYLIRVGFGSKSVTKKVMYLK